MIFVIAGMAWLVSALVVGSFMGRCVAAADRRQAAARTTAEKPLYVADILRAYSASTQH
jgi:hypothetical protein